MRLFLSFASEDRSVAEDVYFALVGDGHDVFFDKPSLVPGQNFELRIRAALEAADAMVFLISPHSIKKGGYALTELKLARQQWAHADGRVLPAIVEATPFKQIPAYLRAVTILQPEGNIAAEVTETLRSWRKRTVTVADKPTVFARVGRFIAVVLGGILIAIVLGTIFSRLYPRVVIDSGLSSLFLLAGVAVAVAVRWVWRLLSRGVQ